MCAYHAVEKTHNTYLVSYDNGYIEGTSLNFAGINEVDVNGRVVREFSYDKCEPRYLVLYKDHVLVADVNGRIILLKSDLQLERILIKYKISNCWRMCLTSSRMLLVSDVETTDIHIFNV
jgi:hypothetical protein